MTKGLEQAMETARGLPPDVQDDMARMVLMFAGDEQPVVEPTPEEDAALARSRIGPMTSRRGMRRIMAAPLPYAIFYHATESEIVVHAVRHSARNPSSMPVR